MNKTRFLIFSLVIFSIFFLGCLEQPQLPRTFINITISINFTGIGDNFTLTKKIRIENRTLLFDALKNNFNINYTTHTTYGAFITSIEGVKNTDTQYWMYYINGEHAMVGVSSYLITEPVNIEWRYEKV